jgi:hypothetical protein
VYAGSTAVVEVTARSPDDPHRCVLTISIDFEAHGTGKLLVALAVRCEAAKEMPRNLQRRKANLESGAGRRIPATGPAVNRRPSSCHRPGAREDLTRDCEPPLHVAIQAESRLGTLL